MRRIPYFIVVLTCSLPFWISRTTLGQQRGQARYVPEDHRPPMFFREDWKHVPANTPEHPVVQESVVTAGLELIRLSYIPVPV
jgi:hypothetical protein